jgi:hypothetical protein
MNIRTNFDSEPPARDPVAERAERQMQVMAQLSEVGMELLRALKAQVCDGGPAVMRGDPASLFVKISRAVRQSIMLEAKIAEALREWLGLSEAERAERRAAGPTQAGKAPVDETPEDLEGIELGADERRFEREHRETERGERPERYWADRYVIEDEGSFLGIVTKVCRDLGVTLDLSSWSEDGPGDLVVTAGEGGSGFWSDVELALATRPATGRGASQRGPPS